MCVLPGSCPTGGTDAKLKTSSGAVYTPVVAANCPPSYEFFCNDPPTCPNGALTYCCPRRAYACIQGQDSGYGNNYITQWYFNSELTACLEFHYRGSGGNGNRFSTEDECRTACMGGCPRGHAQAGQIYVNTDLMRKSHILLCIQGQQPVCDSKHDCIEGGVQLHICCPKAVEICSRTGGLSYPETFSPTGTGFDQGSPKFSRPGSSETRYYYSTATKACESFTFFKQDGNYNNFQSLAECQAVCGKIECTAGEPWKDSSGLKNFDCSRGVSTCPPTHICTKGVCCPAKNWLCSLPAAPGSCSSQQLRWFYDTKVGRCEVFTFTGCGGNDNNFLYQDQCTAFCKDTIAEPQCRHGKAAQNSDGSYIVCSNAFSGLSYNCPSGHECRFDGKTFGCCPAKELTCAAPLDSGILCPPVVARFYYDASTGHCSTFNYFGCGGNSNNFGTRLDCEEYCASGLCPNGGAPAIDSTGITLACDMAQCPPSHQCTIVKSGAAVAMRRVCCPTRDYVCAMTKSEGIQCSATPITRYHFNKLNGRCGPFSYYGCGGNPNNFRTQNECLTFCESADCPEGTVAEHEDFGNSQQSCEKRQINGAGCPFGYTCVDSIRRKHSACCGVPNQGGKCPEGKIPYYDSLSKSYLKCTINLDVGCPHGYICYFSPTAGTAYCCGIGINNIGCPSGSLLQIVDGAPLFCLPTFESSQCQPGYQCIYNTAYQQNTCCLETRSLSG